MSEQSDAEMLKISLLMFALTLVVAVIKPIAWVRRLISRE